MDRVLRMLRVSVLLATCLSAASASDWYVDGAAGNNGNTGASPGDAWKTITHALASTPQTGTQTIHVAPGTYDTGLGETFPWSWRPSLALIGDQGTASTIVVGSPGIPVMRMASISGGNGWVIGNDTLIQGISFQGGSSAIELASDFNEVSPTLRDLAIANTSFAGILVETFGSLFAGAASPVLQNVAISNCALGMAVSANGAVSATDCSFLDNAGSGVASDRSQLSLERCRIEDSGDWGLVFTSGEISLHATTITRNTGGIWGGPVFPSGFLSVATATQCTIADNGSIGVRTDNSPTGGSDVVLDSTIVHGHLDDLALASGSTVQYCEIGDGELAGTAGNFQADPQFVNAAAGNYQLLPGSPCIDAGNPALPIEADCTSPTSERIPSPRRNRRRIAPPSSIPAWRSPPSGPAERRARRRRAATWSSRPARRPWHTGW